MTAFSIQRSNNHWNPQPAESTESDVTTTGAPDNYPLQPKDQYER